MRIKSIGAMSMGKISGLLYGFFGLIAGLVLSLVSIFASLLGSRISDSPEPLVGIFFGVGAVIVLPVFYGFIGFIGGLISAAVYNLIATFVGGIEIELEETAG